jgi:hypothetical protein
MKKQPTQQRQHPDSDGTPEKFPATHPKDCQCKLCKDIEEDRGA